MQLFFHINSSGNLYARTTLYTDQAQGSGVYNMPDAPALIFLKSGNVTTNV